MTKPKKENTQPFIGKPKKNEFICGIICNMHCIITIKADIRYYLLQNRLIKFIFFIIAITKIESNLYGD